MPPLNISNPFRPSAFLAAVGESFSSANVTVDWFHAVQLFTTAVDKVRKAEAKQHKLPKASRWTVLNAAWSHWKGTRNAFCSDGHPLIQMPGSKTLVETSLLTRTGIPVINKEGRSPMSPLITMIT
jgi:hypothetical protein